MARSSFSDSERERFLSYLDNRRYNMLTDCMFFDSEFSRLYTLFKDLNDVFSAIKRRIDMRDFVEITSTRFSRINLEKNKHVNPELVYNFKDSSVEIKIVRVRSLYHVFSTWKGISIPNFRGVPNVYGSYDAVGLAVEPFLTSVNDYLRSKLDELF